MKKLFLIGAVALFGAVNAQTGIKIGAHVGLPVGDASKIYSANFGADVAWVYPLAEKFKVGVVSGYSHYLGKTIAGTNTRVSSYGMVPFGATAHYELTDNVYIGGDIGYGFSMEKNIDGGIYYNPKIGFQFSNFDLNLGYKGASRKITGTSVSSNIGTINLGAAFKF